MMKRFRSSFGIMIALLASMLFLSSCSASDLPLWPNARGWSRAPRIAVNAIGDPVPMTLDAEGHLYFLLVDVQEDRLVPRVLGMNREGETVLDVSLSTTLTQPNTPAIVWDGELLQLFWISNQMLYQTAMTVSGEVSQGPVVISADIKTGDFDVALSPHGDLAVWFSGPRREAGVYAANLEDGSVLALDNLGTRPQLAYGQDNTLHAIWAHYPPGLEESGIYYGAYPEGAVSPGQETRIVELGLGISNLLEGPQLGLSSDTVYVFWTERIMTGMQSGSVRSTYLDFPAGQPDQVGDEVLLRAPQAYELPYEVWTRGSIEAGDRFALDQPGFSRTGAITAMMPSISSSSEIAVAFNVKADYLRRKSEIQIGLLFLDPVPTSYQLVSFTATGSQSAFLFQDGGELYLTWLEKTNRATYEVYFSSTAEDISTVFNAVESSDVWAIVGQSLFGLLSGMLLLPMGLIWFVFPILVVAAGSFLRGDSSNFWSPLSMINLLLAMGAYWASKLMILPGIRTYVPFSAWIPVVPAAWRLPLQIGVPAFITLLAIVSAYQFTRHREQQSLLFFMLIYGAIDTILTLGVYGVLIYGG